MSKIVYLYSLAGFNVDAWDVGERGEVGEVGDAGETGDINSSEAVFCYRANNLVFNSSKAGFEV